MNGRQIKGGGRAIMSRDSQEALIDILMRLSSSEDEKEGDKSLAKTVSEHERKRREKKFIRRLVQEHERKQYQRKFRKSVNGNSNSNSNCNSDGDGDGDGNDSREMSSNPVPTPSSAAAAPADSIGSITTKRADNNGNGNEKVRIELVEAIFKDEKKDNKKEKKEKKAKKDKKKTSSSEPKFKEGAKKIMVLPRSTTTKELLKIASSKLKVKKPVRAFLKVSKTIHWNLDGEGGRDLSGVDDGATVYVTTTPEPTEGEKKSKSGGGDDDDDDNEEEENRMDPIDENSDEVDTLDMVKRAYEKQEQNRNRRHMHRHRQRESSSDGYDDNRIDDELKAKHALVRAGLPAASYKEKILDSVHDNRVVVLCGATGCGKSTQVPQFLLEHEEEREEQPEPEQQQPRAPQTQTQTKTHHKHKYIVVTQPRRVAAIALANRVADERGSPPPGEAGSSVGYMVRSDKRVDELSCRIIYMTVGILLRMLVSQSQSQSQSSEANKTADTDDEIPRSSFSINNISHLIIDEVHERDVNTDFTLTLLKGLMLSPSSSKLSHLRLILMSATASSDLFVNYFTPNKTLSRPPVVLEIPGRTFPVETKWLPECQKFSGTTMWRPNNSNHNKSGVENENENDARTMSGPALSSRARDKIDDKFVRALIAKIVQEQQYEGQLQRSAGNKSHSKGYRKTGAILVFLPGRGEIESMAACLRDNSTIAGDREICTILKLHSAIPKNEQQRVFQPALEGTVKIVLATNIAETSVTISDVTHVIDACRVKESRYNASTRIRELVTVWTSRASLKQRAGRAGRTSSGVCWRLCSEDFFEKELLPQTAPEMLRTPLDELVLQICLLYEQRRDDFYKSNKGGGSFPTGAKPIKFLSLTPAPPPKNSLLQACRHLLEVDALRVVDKNGKEGEEDAWSYRLTPLGYHLSRLPMDAKVGKVLIVGCILGCLDGALTVAAALSCTKSCFLSGFGNQANLPVAYQARESLIENGFGGKDWHGGTVKGDLIAVIAAYRAWKKHKSDEQKWKFCNYHAMDNIALREMDRLRHQFKDLLIDAGFVPRPQPRHGNHGAMEEDGGYCNQASEDALLNSCCLVAGLYPNICSLIRPRKGGPRGGRLYTNDGDECRPQSNSFQRKRLQQAAETGKDAYAVYHAKHRSIGTESSSSTGGQRQRPPEVFLTEVNFVSRFALLLFGGDLEIVKNAIIVDGWLKFKVSGDGNKAAPKKGGNGNTVDNAVLILALREKLDEMILEHVLESSATSRPGENSKLSSERHQGVIRVVRKLLSEEG